STAPCACAVYHTAASGAGATSCGALPVGTAKVSNDGGCACAEPMVSAALARADANHGAGRASRILFTVAATRFLAIANMFASVSQDEFQRALTVFYCCTYL